MSRCNHRTLNFLTRWLLCRLCVLSLLLSVLSPTAQATDPEVAVKPLAVSLPAEALADLTAGDSLSFNLPVVDSEGLQGVQSVNAIIDGEDHYINGDRVLFARGDVDVASSGLRMVLTVGDTAVFAEITQARQRWVFEGRKAGGLITGFIYQPDLSVQASAQHVHTSESAADFVIPQLITPDGLKRPAATEQRTQPFVADAHNPSDHTQYVQSAESALQISQQFNRTALYIGQSADIEVTVEFRNTGSQALSRLTADIYFILEDTELIAAPACVRTQSNTSPRQPVLRCELPGGLAAGAVRTMSYRVKVPAKPAPVRLWSTVLSGSQRNDANLNVVRDITRNATMDGFSAFNQALLPELMQDDLGNVVIDVMTLYTPDAEAMYGPATATRINQMIGIANQIYQDSGVAITLRPVHQARVNYPGTAVDMYRQLDELTTGGHPAFAHVSDLRERYGADLVVLMRTRDPQSNMCGLANLGGYRTLGDMTSFGERDFAYSLVAIDCPVSSVLAHELGHNMGLTHSIREDGEGGTFPFATGYGVEGQFTTVMATPSRFGNGSRIARFSDPEADCKALPCGIPYTDQAQGAHAALALNLVRFQIAAYLPTRVARLPGRRVARFDGGASAARIAIAASADKGLSHVDSVNASEALDITADFYIDPAHIGKTGQFHVVADLGAAGLGMIQLNERGETFSWDGSLAGLVPFSAPVTLKAIEYLRILSDFVPVPELHGHPLVLYVAYQLPGSGELIYTLDPLTVNISNQP